MAPSQGGARSSRLAEILCSLSLAIDLSMAKPAEWVMRSCALGMRLCRLLGMSGADSACTYYVILLRHVGCTSTAEEESRLFGDEMELRRVMPDILAQTITAPSHDANQHRAEAALPGLAAQHCEVAERMAAQLELGPAVGRALGQVYERWDGAGHPLGLAGAEIETPARIAYFALDMAFHASRGVTHAAEMARAGQGHAYDPSLSRLFLESSRELLAELDSPSLRELVLSLEPEPRVALSGEGLDRALLALADFSDAHCSCFLGHSRKLAEVSARAARLILPEHEGRLVRQAALVHGLGKVAVSSVVWDRPGPLTEPDWERVRLYPHHTERILSRSPAFSEAAQVAPRLQERMNGSGYHRGLRARDLSPAARLLAAAKAYCAMTEDRPHRPALSAEAAVARLREEARAGLLEIEAVNAVSSVAGQGSAFLHPQLPFQLTPRELDVLRLIARGCTNKEMAKRLSLSDKTVGHYVERLYARIDVRTRAGAVLFAVQNNLLDRAAW